MKAAETADLVYLRPDVKMEPLVYRWHAWSHLIAPAQLAMHIAFRIAPLLKSFLSDNGVHVLPTRIPPGSADTSSNFTRRVRMRSVACWSTDAARLVSIAEGWRKLEPLLYAEEHQGSG